MSDHVLHNFSEELFYFYLEGIDTSHLIRIEQRARSSIIRIRIPPINPRARSTSYTLVLDKILPPEELEDSLSERLEWPAGSNISLHLIASEMGVSPELVEKSISELEKHSFLSREIVEGRVIWYDSSAMRAYALKHLSEPQQKYFDAFLEETQGVLGYTARIAMLAILSVAREQGKESSCHCDEHELATKAAEIEKEIMSISIAGNPLIARLRSPSYVFPESDYEKVINLASRFKGQVWRRWGNLKELIADFSNRQMPLFLAERGKS